MNRTQISLDAIEVASPCQAPWEQMAGDDRSRFCSECQLNVYNLSDMSRDEAQAVVNAREGRLCVRFFRRADGTILTQDCPVGLRAVRRSIAKVAAGIAALLSFLGAGAVAARTISDQQKPASGGTSPLVRIAEWLDPQPPVAMGKFVAGGLACPAPPIVNSTTTANGQSDEPAE